MKKLLIAMTAAAVGTCAWAEENAGGSEPTTPAAPTYLNAATETFANWVNGTDGYVTSVAAPWSYGTVADNDDDDSVVTATDPSADELKVVDGALSLNTGSKALRGAFAADEVAIPTSGLYFSSKVTFKDPSDTLPKLGAKDKFALVVLDNVESIENEVADTPSTNLFVIAKYGQSETRAYELNIAIDDEWLARSHNIEVKAYNNVMKNGTCAGFLVWVDDKVCKVLYSYAIENEVVNFKYGVREGGVFEGENQDGIGYLGVEKSAIAPSMLLRYTNKELLLSNYAGDANLASVDFQGQGTIDDVALKTDATYATFGTDSLVFTVEGTENGVTITSDATVYYTAAGETKNITFTLATGWVLKGVAKDLTPDANGVYTYVYTTVADNDQVVKIEAYQPAAYIGDTPYESFTLALAAVTAGGELKLSDAVATTVDIGSSKNLVLDLNGKTVADIYNEGTLTIKDSSVEKNGTVGINAKYGCSVDNYGTLTILGGCFDGKILNDGGTVTISGGKFKDTDGLEDALAEGLAFSDTADTDGYYSVVTATVTPLPEITIPDDATPEVEKAAVEAALGDQADEAVKANITNKTEYAAFKTWAGTNGGAATVVASVNAWVAYALDNAGLLDDAKVTLTDNDIKVESFGQDTAEGAAAGQFTLEISLKDVTIGAATKANLLKIFEAVGTTDLKADFTAGAVTTDVMAVGGKAKFTVAPSAATKPNAFFFKAQIKK